MISVTVALALPHRQEVVALRLGEGSTVADALAAANLAGTFRRWTSPRRGWGIWSRRARGTTRLRDGDRVEIYRPLRADPKEMRRGGATQTFPLISKRARVQSVPLRRMRLSWTR